MGSSRTLRRRKARQRHRKSDARRAHLRLHPEDATTFERIHALTMARCLPSVREALAGQSPFTTIFDRR